jgi:hypothetical protein
MILNGCIGESESDPVSECVNGGVGDEVYVGLLSQT